MAPSGVHSGSRQVRSRHSTPHYLRSASGCACRTRCCPLALLNSEALRPGVSGCTPTEPSLVSTPVQRSSTLSGAPAVAVQVRRLAGEAPSGG